MERNGGEAEDLAAIWPGRESERYPAHPSADDARGESAPATSRCFECALPVEGDRPPDRQLLESSPTPNPLTPGSLARAELAARTAITTPHTADAERRRPQGDIAIRGPDVAVTSEYAARQSDRAFASMSHARDATLDGPEPVADPDPSPRSAWWP